MDQVIADRITTHTDEPFVVFLLGMRVNQFWNFKHWIPVAAAAPKMVQELITYPEKGYLGGTSFFSLWPLTTCFVSYWKSFEHLERFARSKDDTHFPAWRDFMKRTGYNGAVGIWHETYVIESGKYEALYGNMPLFGWAKAMGNPISIRSKMPKARERLTGKDVQRPAELEIESAVAEY